MKYDLELFTQLNEEYRDRPLVPAPRLFDKESVLSAGEKKAAQMAERFKLADQRVLEIGCGRGEVAAALIEKTGCSVVGVDIVKRPEWDFPEMAKVQFIKADLSQPGTAPDIGTFDFAYSLVVWEHVHHPYALLERVRSLLKPGGEFFISANLHRGPMASHRYREVFFPWPHLLFSDEVFEQFYASIGIRPRKAAWVNTLTTAHYLHYFQQLSFEVVDLSFSMNKFDAEFYARFEDILGRHPRYDLERDFIHAHVKAV